MKGSVRIVYSLVAVLSLVTAVWPQEKVDLETITRIRYEGFRNSKVMELASGLMDSIGERLTGSPNMKRANEWTRDQLTAMGLSNAHLEPWGPFGRGWANQYINVRMTSPDMVPLLAYAKAWTPGTNGVVSAKCVRVNIEDKKDFDKYRGKLAGTIVILGPDAEVKTITEAPFKRLSDDELAKISEYEIPGERPAFRMAEIAKRRQFIKDLNQFFADEKVLAVIDHSRGTAGGGTVFVQSGGSYKTGETTTVPQLTMASEHWSRIARLLQQKKDVTLELNVANTFYDDDPMQYDTIAEIPVTSESHAATARADRDGAAGVARRRRDSRSQAKCVARVEARRAGQCARPRRACALWARYRRQPARARLFAGTRHPAQFAHRDLRRAQGLYRQLAMVGRPVLPAHRQAHGRPHDVYLRPVQGRAADPLQSRRAIAA